eukprot:986254-Prymnesium_polylepis.1
MRESCRERFALAILRVASGVTLCRILFTLDAVQSLARFLSPCDHHPPPPPHLPLLSSSLSGLSERRRPL